MVLGARALELSCWRMVNQSGGTEVQWRRRMEEEEEGQEVWKHRGGCEAANVFRRKAVARNAVDWDG